MVEYFILPSELSITGAITNLRSDDGVGGDDGFLVVWLMWFWRLKLE